MLGRNELKLQENVGRLAGFLQQQGAAGSAAGAAAEPPAHAAPVPAAAPPAATHARIPTVLGDPVVDALQRAAGPAASQAPAAAAPAATPPQAPGDRLVAALRARRARAHASAAAPVAGGLPTGGEAGRAREIVAGLAGRVARSAPAADVLPGSGAEGLRQAMDALKTAIRISPRG